jgi:anthranilate synthase component 1
MPARLTKRVDAATPSAAEFVRLSRGHSLVPVYRTVTADLETPVGAFLRVAQRPNGEPEPEAFLLESVEGGEHVGRYTFIGIEPYKRIVSRGRAIVVEEDGLRREFEGDIFEELKAALGGHTPARLAGLPPFTAGAVGFFSYDVVRQIERLPERAKDELGVPDACLMFFDQVLAFDHVKKEIHLIVTADFSRDKRKPAEVYAATVRRLGRLEKRLAGALPKPAKKKALGKLKLTARTSKAAFLRGVETDEGVHRGGRCVSVCAVAAVRLCAGGGCVRGVSRAADCESFAVYVFFAVWAGGCWEEGEGDARAYCGVVAGVVGKGAWRGGGVSTDCGDAASWRG